MKTTFNHRRASDSRRSRQKKHDTSAYFSSGLIETSMAVLRKQAGQRATDLFRQAKDQGQRFVDDRKSDLAEKLVGVRDTIRRAADKLYDQHIDPVAHYVDGAAHRVEQTARYLEDRDFEDMLNDVGRLARRRPMLFFTAMFVTGLLAARFVKASSGNMQKNASNGSVHRRRPAAGGSRSRASGSGHARRGRRT